MTHNYRLVSDSFPSWVINYIEINYGKENNLPEWASIGLAEVGINVEKFVGEKMKGKKESSTRHDRKSTKA